MMEFGDPVHILGITLFVSFISLMIGSQLFGPEKENEKTD